MSFASKLSAKQRGVLRGMMTGVVVTVTVLAAAIIAHPPALTPPPGATAALTQALRWDVLLALCLMMNIGLLARHRFFTPADIDGGGLSRGTAKAQVLQAVLQNTLEQTVLGVAAHLVWAAATPRTWQAAIPAAAVLFVIGRALFWRGYAQGAPARALGFALTFYPSAALLLVAFAWLVRAIFS